MNKRKLQKQKTRELILQTAKNEFIKNGFLNTTTAQIAQSAGIAHGTLFLHFSSKNILIVEILDSELDLISAGIQKLILNAADLEEMLRLYLDKLQESEDFFSAVARELPFYPDELRRMILFRDSILRSNFTQVIETEIKAGKFKAVPQATAVDFLFGTINHFLSLKQIYCKEDSVIAKFKTSIIDTFLTFLNKEKGD